MFEIMAEKIVNKLVLDSVIDENQAIYRYGIELIISTLAGTLLIFIEGIVLNQFINALLFEILFSLTRVSFGGYHCKSYFRCISSYVGWFTASILIQNYVNVDLQFLLILLFVYAVVIFICCPVKNGKKHLTDEELKKHRYKSLFFSVFIPLVILMMRTSYLWWSNYCFIVYTILIILIVGGKIEYEKTKI